MNGQANIQRLKRAVQAGRSIPDDVRTWFLAGLGRWEGSGDSLQVALGLVRDREALELRDSDLRYAAELMPTNWSGRERVNQIQRAARNLSMFSDFDLIDWRNRPAWHEPLARALHASPLPGSRRLFDLCNKSKSCTKTRAS